MSLASVAARFYVRAVEKFAYANATKSNPAPGWAPPAPVITVKLAVVSGNRAPENQQWASATPSGEITMTIGNPEAAAFFEELLGQDLEVIFRPRPADEIASQE